MARTRSIAANANAFHRDDGIVLGKGGEPIPTTPIRGVPTLNPHAAPAAKVQHMDDGEIVPPAGVAPVPPPAPPQYVWVCDKTTWGRNMDGWQALQLLNVMLGSELSATLTHEQMGRLPQDARWHFRRKVVEVPVEGDDEADGREGGAA